MVVYILSGTLLGLIVSAISLLLGASVGWAFVVFVLVSNITTLLAETVFNFFRTTPGMSPDVADSKYLGNRNSRPAEYLHPLIESSQ